MEKYNLFFVAYYSITETSALYYFCILTVMSIYKHDVLHLRSVGRWETNPSRAKIFSKSTNRVLGGNRNGSWYQIRGILGCFVWSGNIINGCSKKIQMWHHTKMECDYWKSHTLYFNFNLSLYFFLWFDPKHHHIIGAFHLLYPYQITM